MQPTVIIRKLFPADYGLHNIIKDFRSKILIQITIKPLYYVRMQNSYIEDTPFEERYAVFLP